MWNEHGKILVNAHWSQPPDTQSIADICLILQQKLLLALIPHMIYTTAKQRKITWEIPGSSFLDQPKSRDITLL